MAKSLEANGAAKVFIIGRDFEKLENAAKQGVSHQKSLSISKTTLTTSQKHGNIIPIQGDVTKKGDLIRIAASVKESVGYVNLVIANAGAAAAGRKIFPPKNPQPPNISLEMITGITPGKSTIEEVQEFFLTRPWEAYTQQFDIHVCPLLSSSKNSLFNPKTKPGNSNTLHMHLLPLPP